MKNISLFEEFSQNLSEAITLDEFKNLKPGQLVHYMGSGYHVVNCDGLTLDLQNPDEEDDTLSVNYNMFKAKGFINEDMKPLTYSGGDVTKMPVIGTILTKKVGPFKAETLKVVEIIEGNGTIYVLDRWYKPGIPNLVHEQLVDKYNPL